MKIYDRAVALTEGTAKLASQLAEARPKLTSRAPVGRIQLASAVLGPHATGHSSSWLSSWQVQLARAAGTRDVTCYT